VGAWRAPFVAARLPLSPLGNRHEPYASLWGHGQAFPTPDSSCALQVGQSAIRGADSKAQIGVDIHSDHMRWGNYLLKELAGDYDFVAPHYYCAPVFTSCRSRKSRSRRITDADRALRINALLRAYNPQRESASMTLSGA